jgi:hypothetical protein
MRASAIAALTMLAACGQGAVQTPPAGPQSPSAQIVIDRLALIDACLALAPARRTVTINSESATTLRLSGEAGDVDCVVPNDDASPANAVIVPALDPASTDSVLFVRAPGENPGGECYQAPEVRNANGELLGWTLDPAGC